MQPQPDGSSGATEAARAEAPAAVESTEATTAAITPAEAGGVASDPVTADTATPAGDGATADADAAAAADDADLQSYPESVREQFKNLTSEQRKSLYEHAESRVSEKIQRERERNDRLEADRKAAEARAAEIRAKTGKFVGAEAQTVTLPDGTEQKLPAYDDLVRLLQTRRGRDTLYDQYGLDEDAAESWKAQWEQNGGMIDAVADHFDNRSWTKIDASLRDGIKQAGYDPADVLSGASSPQQVIAQLTERLKADHEAAIKKLSDGYEGRITALTANQEGMRGKVLAATARGLAEGGRSASGDSHIYTRAELAAMDTATYRANREEIDRQVDAGLVR